MKAGAVLVSTFWHLVVLYQQGSQVAGLLAKVPVGNRWHILKRNWKESNEGTIYQGVKGLRDRSRD